MIFSDEILGAYVDGELDAAQQAQVATAAIDNAEIAQRIERLRAVRNKLLAGFSGVAQEPVPQRLLDAVHKAPLSAVRQPKQRRWSWPELGAIAASVLVSAVLGYFLLRSPDPDLFARQHSGLVARGALAKALATQLAGEQPRDANVRIGISFRDRNGVYCRTFGVQSREPLAGMACRENSAWQVKVLAQNESSAPGSGGAEPAGSALPGTVLRAVENKITGEPLDAAGEAAARLSNWETH